MINLTSISQAMVKKDNVTFALTSNLVDKIFLEKLIEFYPAYGFEECIRNEGPKKHYAFHLINLVLKNEINLKASHLVNPLWIDLAKALLSDEYRGVVSEYLDIDLSEVDVNIGLYKFDPGNWVAPHVDNEDKILTQIFYFNESWSLDWGGHFKLLNSKNAEDEYFSVPPFANFSVLLLRNDFAWHMVTPVAPKAKCPRLSMQLEFIKREK